MTSLGYSVNTMAELFWSTLLEGYCSCPKRLNERAIHLSRYPKNMLGPITYLLKCGRVLSSPTKIYKEINTLMRVLQTWPH
jgi:hypothetical protein